jgi:hypothetical protein
MTEPTAFVYAGRKWSESFGLENNLSMFTMYYMVLIGLHSLVMTLNAVLYSLSVVHLYTPPYFTYSHSCLSQFIVVCTFHITSHFAGHIFLEVFYGCFSEIPRWTCKVSQNISYHVRYLYHRNIVLNEILLMFGHRRIMKFVVIMAG